MTKSAIAVTSLPSASNVTIQATVSNAFANSSEVFTLRKVRSVRPRYAHIPPVYVTVLVPFGFMC
jgi:hypothetical protein